MAQERVRLKPFSCGVFTSGPWRPGRRQDPPGVPSEPTIVACATALPGTMAAIRLSGPQARAIAGRTTLPLPPAAWRHAAGHWPLAGGACPVRIWWASAPATATGCDVVEIVLPGSHDLVELALAALVAGGATPAPPGGFVRQALVHGRISLDQAEGVLAVVTAGDEDAARRAVARLAGDLGRDLDACRADLLRLRALVEAGLDFNDEDDVRSHDPVATAAACASLRDRLGRWRVAADTSAGDPVVCLVGRANAGKSALFSALTGTPALVSPVAGTTRDPLVAAWDAAGRRVTLVDTAGWMEAATDVDNAAAASARRWVDGAALVIACSSPDALLPADLPADAVVVATKCDLGVREPRAVLAVSVATATGLDQLAGLVSARLSGVAGGEPRQQRLLAEAWAVLNRLAAGSGEDALLADDLRRVDALLADLIGRTTADDILDAIFSRFCIGK